ncbi:MAG: hypothetical protein HPY45_01170 [Anaerolineae bacterium]|nr:hypothetical protein [Anaerolineae bacterium]
MGFLIDGHNVIAMIPGLSLKMMDDEQELIALLQVFCRVRRKTAEVYFDGAPPGYAGKRKFGAVSAFFVPQGVTADAALLSRMRELRGRGESWTVVSSDRSIQAEARVLRHTVMDSGQFVKALQQAAYEVTTPERKGKQALSGEEVEEWLRLFGVREEE